MGKLSKDKRDIYYRHAKEEGYRARSAYKLMQIDSEFDLLNRKSVVHVVDLCAAPGSWSQVVSKRIWEPYVNERDKAIEENLKHTNLPEPVLIAVDMQEMAPIPGISILQGDITCLNTLKQIYSLLNQNLADLVLCDGAPDVTGMHDLDVYIQSQLLLSALSITTKLLRDQGTFVAKVFRGEMIPILYSQLLTIFDYVYCCKPSSSRNSSLEAFVVCQNFNRNRANRIFDQLRDGSNINFNSPSVPLLHSSSFTFIDKQDAPELPSDKNLHSELVDSTIDDICVPFIACGDLRGYDSDRNFPLEENYKPCPPVQPPINAPYSEAVKMKRSEPDLHWSC